MALRHIRMPWLPHSAAGGEQGWSRVAVPANLAASAGNEGKEPCRCRVGDISQYEGETRGKNTAGVGTRAYHSCKLCGLIHTYQDWGQTAV